VAGTKRSWEDDEGLLPKPATKIQKVSSVEVMDLEPAKELQYWESEEEGDF